jgi:hypothetical protein
MTPQLLTVEDVISRQANSARGPFQIYEVQMGGTPYRARKPVYDLALTLRGQQVYAETRQEQNGQWTNYFVDSLALAPQGQAQNLAAPQYGNQVPEPQAYAEAPSYVPTGKDVIIWRQTATKVAADLLGPGDSEESFWANVEKLIWFYETGQHGYDVPFG